MKREFEGKVGDQIRGTHPYAFRSGQWATITTYTTVNKRWCYNVRFDDGLVDQWPVEDKAAGYEFKRPVTMTPERVADLRERLDRGLWADSHAENLLKELVDYIGDLEGRLDKGQGL